MKMKKNYIIFLSLIFLSLNSCRKEFLDVKPDSSLVVPTSLEDFQAILDNIKYMNGATSGTFGTVGYYGGPNPIQLELGADNYYIPEESIVDLSPFDLAVYLWSKDASYGGSTSLSDWSFPYRTVFYSNTVLDGLKKVKPNTLNDQEINQIRGSALFFRAWSFYQLSQAFAPLYEKGKAKDLLGIPLRLTADISEKSIRSNLEETYNQIIADLNEAASLLPNAPLYKTRPSAPAAYGLLSRLYLSMSDFENAKVNAEKCISTYNKPLLNYNNLGSSTYPIPKFNDEAIFSSICNFPISTLFQHGSGRIDNQLYNSYLDNDLRKTVFFRQREPNVYSFRGSYDGNALMFFGIATDELYINLAECHVRLHDVKSGLKYLNDLLTTRFKNIGGISSFVPYNTTNEDQALTTVLNERRKELVMRGLRFSDLRRLNKDSRFAKTIFRTINGVKTELAPNDSRYTWPIPNDVIALTGMPQNPQ